MYPYEASCFTDKSCNNTNAFNHVELVEEVPAIKSSEIRDIMMAAITT